VTIRAVELTNFKGIGGPVRIELRPITLLFGGNSAGKSTVLQALLYAREILERRNIDPDRTQQGGPYVDLGGFRNLVHNHDLAQSVTLKFELDLSSVDLSDYLDGYEVDTTLLHKSDETDQLSLIEAMSGIVKSAAVNVTVRWSELLEEPIWANYETEINGDAAVRIRTETGSHALDVVEFNLKHPWFLGADTDPSVGEDHGPDVLAFPGKPAESPRQQKRPDWQRLQPIDTSTHDIPSRQIRTLFNEIQRVLDKHDLTETGSLVPFVLIAPGQYLLEQLRKLRYLGPIREVPPRNYQPSLSPEESRWANGLGAWDWIYFASKDSIAELNAWLTREDRLNCGYRVDVKRYKEIDVNSMLMLALQQGADLLDNYPAIKEDLEARPTKARVIIRREEDFLEVAPQDVGIGISQVIPVLVSALDNVERLRVIEQPELHIHPALQVALGDLFIYAKASGPEGHHQFLIETHSEHLLLRLLRRIRETSEAETPLKFPLLPSELAIYFVEATAEGTAIKFLALDENGNFKERWPRGFFDEREREFFGDPGSISDEDLGRILGK
jgi:hypothetical protein